MHDRTVFVHGLFLVCLPLTILALGGAGENESGEDGDGVYPG